MHDISLCGAQFISFSGILEFLLSLSLSLALSFPAFHSMKSNEGSIRSSGIDTLGLHDCTNSSIERFSASFVLTFSRSFLPSGCAVVLVLQAVHLGR